MGGDAQVSIGLSRHQTVPRREIPVDDAHLTQIRHPEHDLKRTVSTILFHHSCRSLANVSYEAVRLIIRNKKNLKGYDTAQKYRFLRI